LEYLDGLEPGAIPTFEEYERAARVTQNGESFYVVERDIALDHQGLVAYYERAYLEERPKAVTMALTSPDYSGLDKRVGHAWITYCFGDGWGVSDNRGTTGNKAGTVETVRLAARDWQRQANVRFIYAPSHDGSNCTASADAGDVDIAVVPSRAQDGTAHNAYSTAALPLQSPQRLNLGRAAETTNGLAMVLHEVGHLLGLRHEQDHPQSVFGCSSSYGYPSPLQEAGPVALTAYDPASIMHYLNVVADPNGGGNCTTSGGTWVSGMRLSSLDGYGARVLYGAPDIFDQIPLVSSL
jgi:hypothetical protein